jgi:hypothetical protein
MKITVSVLAVAALLAGCNSGGAKSFEFGPDSGATSLGTMHADHHKSWVSPDAGSNRYLLFISDHATGDVDIFALPGLKLEGTLTGFHDLGSECSDRSGHVYIVSQALNGTIGEYSRTGSLLNSYTDPYGSPAACAVNPTNGDLAVTDNISYCGSDCSAGHVLIFSSPSSPPKVVQNPVEDNYDSVGYNPRGVLWEDGSDFNGHVLLSSCGNKKCKTINLSGGSIYSPGTVLWDKTHANWVIFDLNCNRYGSGSGYGGACSYPVSAQGVLGPQTMYLTDNGGQVCDLVQAVIAPGGKSVAGGDYDWCGYDHSVVARWGYPSGGNPTKEYIGAEPVGAAISAMPR